MVFTDPELAWCGLTEAQAAEENRQVTVAKFPWGASGRAITLDRTDGLTKLILDPETERLLGVGLVGPGAGELIAEGVLAIEMGANATDLQAHDPSAPDAHRDADGVGRSLLRPGDAPPQTETRLTRTGIESDHHQRAHAQQQVDVVQSAARRREPRGVRDS